MGKTKCQICERIETAGYRNGISICPICIKSLAYNKTNTLLFVKSIFLIEGKKRTTVRDLFTEHYPEAFEMKGKIKYILMDKCKEIHKNIHGSYEALVDKKMVKITP